jgi:hypothetical protein
LSNSCRSDGPAVTNAVTVYDHLGRAVSVTTPLGVATNGAIRLEYVYNHKNLRVAKIKKRLSGRGADYPFNPLQPGTWDAIETRRYVWDGYNIAAEIVIDEVAPSTNVTYYTWVSTCPAPCRARAASAGFSLLLPLILLSLTV